jgi:putative acetyltransferase
VIVDDKVVEDILSRALPPEVRLEQARDRDAVLDIHRRAFRRQGGTIADLVQSLRRDDPAALSLVAEQAGEIVGHVMFTRNLLDAPSRLTPVQVLSPLAVLPWRQRRGIGSRLVRHGLRLLDERGVPLVFLEGDPRYYSRLGFIPGGERAFRKPSLRIPDAAFQVATLSAYEPWMTGTLVYASAFWEHDSVGLRDPKQ